MHSKIIISPTKVHFSYSVHGLYRTNDKTKFPATAAAETKNTCSCSKPNEQFHKVINFTGR